MFGKKKINILCIDEGYVYLFFFTRGADGLKLNRYVDCAYSETSSLKAFLEQEKVEGAPLYVVYPGEKTLTKTLILRKKDRKNLKDVVRQTVLDCVLDEIESYKSFSSAIYEDKDKVVALLTLVRDKEVKEVYKVLHSSKYCIDGMVPIASCYYNALIYLYPNNDLNLMLVDIRNGKIYISFLFEKMFWFRQVTISMEGSRFHSDVLRVLSESIYYFRNKFFDAAVEKVLVNEQSWAIFKDGFAIEDLSGIKPEKCVFEGKIFGEKNKDNMIPAVGLAVNVMYGAGVNIDILSGFCLREKPVQTILSKVPYLCIAVSGVFLLAGFLYSEKGKNIKKSDLDSYKNFSGKEAMFGCVVESSPSLNGMSRTLVSMSKRHGYWLALLGCIQDNFTVLVNGRLKRLSFSEEQDVDTTFGLGFLELEGDFMKLGKKDPTEVLNSFTEALGQLTFIKEVIVVSCNELSDGIVKFELLLISNDESS